MGPTYACNFGSQEHPHAGLTRQESKARRTMDPGIPSPHRNGPPVRRPSSPRRPMSRSSNVMKCHALPMPATTHVRLQKGGSEQIPVRYAYNQQTIYHNFELTCLMLQYRDINSITIVDHPTVRPQAVVRQLAAGSKPMHATKTIRASPESMMRLGLLRQHTAYSPHGCSSAGPGCRVSRPWRCFLLPSMTAHPAQHPRGLHLVRLLISLNVRDDRRGRRRAAECGRR